MKEKIRYKSKNIHYPCGCTLHVSKQRDPSDCGDFEEINIETHEICDKHSEFAIEEPRCSICYMPFDSWKEAEKCKHESIIIPSDVRAKLDKIIERNKERVIS